jgi:hypothetical protein
MRFYLPDAEANARYWQATFLVAANGSSPLSAIMMLHGGGLR